MQRHAVSVRTLSCRDLVLRAGALLLLLLAHNAQGFINSPKIITKDGNLIVESGLNRNISFQLQGNSRININDEYDLLELLLLESKARNGSASGTQRGGIDDVTMMQYSNELSALKTYVFGVEGLDKRLRGLQNRTRTTNQALRRYQTRLQRVERRVQSLWDRLEVDNCKSNPCENAGICINIFSGFICKCTKNFEGPTCKNDVNECALFTGTDLGCQNGGQCVNQYGSYSCICSAGWYGIHCTQRRGDCMQASGWELCGHGTCVSSNDDFGYKCICDAGWKTNGLVPACTVDVDECSESHTPCMTKCINLPGSFTCAPCGAGLTGNGINCRDIDECAAQNGGCSMSPKVACMNSYGSFHCGECPIGWIGDGRTCTRREGTSDGSTGTATSCAGNNICHPSATCTEVSNTVVCSCPTGMIGSGVGVNGCVMGTQRNCASMPCLNGGTCMDSGASYICLCPMGYRGPNCTPIPSPCTPNPCHNNGRCRATGGTQVTCQCPPGYSGRLCDNRHSRCGGVLAGTVGRLKYPEGSLYDHMAQCAWVIRTNESLVLNVTFNAFELEDASECRFDWLQINDGRTAGSQIIGRFCGAHKPQGGNIISSTNDLYLWFRSDNSTAKAGFDLEWNSIPPQCGGIIDVDTHGTIASPGSPGNYPKNRDCRWQLRAPFDKRLKLTFFSMQIEKHDSCNYDYLEVFDDIAETTIVKYCNSSAPSPLLLPTNEATIHFHSDNEGTDLGFQIYYSVEERVPGCGGTFTAKEGVITSPKILGDSISCEYYIEVPVGQSIRIEFSKFEMGKEDCIELYDVNLSNRERTLEGKYCGDYADPPTIFSSMYNAVRMKYYAKTGQFELKYSADCSYTFESNSDVIQSPAYPKLRNIDRLCTYKISTEPSTVISVKVLDFDVNDNSMDDNECTFSALRINDGLNQNMMGPYCGNSTPPTDFVSKANMLLINFQSGLTTYGRGFKIEYRAIPMGKSDCGGVFTKPSYKIRLPLGEDGLYLNNMECYWIIMAPPGKGILINWQSFSMEQTMDCMYDYIEIYDNLADNENGRPLGRYCDSPPSFLSPSRMLTIKFVSDSSDAADGFEATYEFVDMSKQCGGDVYASTGRIYSPGYPANYTADMDCVWTINTPAGTQMELSFDMFELQASDDCAHDWLKIRNGGSVQSPLIGTYCGTTIPRVIPSFTHQMRIYFHSDSFLNARGFQIRWYVFSNGCGGDLKANTGVITSPLYPNPYPHDAECDWLVHVPKGSSIHFTIMDLKIEELFECQYDYLEIFEGRSSGQQPLVKLCKLEENEPKELVITKSEALVRFRSDSSQTERGFLLTYYTNCTRTLSDLMGVIESPNYGNTANMDLVNCSWTIKAPKGNQIALQFVHYEKRDGGNGIYFKQPGQNMSLVQVTTSHDNFTSIGDTLTILQNSSLVDFRLEYTMFGCVQSFHRDTGGFESPNYPKTYPNNMECMWEIHTELGSGIELTVSDMDIEQTVNCTSDALVISGHRDGNNPKERHCGKSDDLVITSSSHLMFVRFFSNEARNGKGFSAAYRTLKSKCGGTLKSKNGVIMSPNYPYNYPPNSNCEWNIEVSHLHTITLTMEEIDMENYYSCETDYVEAYEMSNDGEINTDDAVGNKLFSECGLAESAPTEWTTTTNRAVIRFQSDDSIQAKGFKLSYKENCGQNVQVGDDDYGYIEISRYGQTDEVCVWHLVAKDLSKRLLLTPTHVQLSVLAQMSYKNEIDCKNGGVKIYDGIDDKGAVRSMFCKEHPPSIYSNGHALTLKVPLNVTSEFVAYYLQIDSYCGSVYRSISGKFSTPNFPASYSVNMNCEWYMETSAGNSLVLTFESLDLEDSEDCNHDYVEVRESDESGRLLGVFCGSRTPDPITGASSLWVKFSSDNDVVGQGFFASYNYATHNELTGINGTIESPHYPSNFHSSSPYTWRITVDNEYAVLVTIKHVTDVDIPFIQFYDGYTDIGLQIDYSNKHFIYSSTSIVYLKAWRGPFQFEWSTVSKSALRDNQTLEDNAKACGKGVYIVGPNAIVTVNSPGYPHGYAPNLNCSWVIMPDNPATHIVAQFSTIDLEDISDCATDYVAVASSADLQSWRELDKLCKKGNTTFKAYHGIPYLRLSFVTDVSINKTGFSSFVRTACGSEITDRQGFVNITSLAVGPNSFQMECVWKIRVRLSRRIRIRFVDSYLQPDNAALNCRAYFVVRNGIAEESPFLGKGKYCDNNITDVLETTSNRAYIKFSRTGFPRFRASFYYEEISHQCSDVIVLREDTLWERSHTISSPNYPNIANPHSECIWRVEAPLHHIIAIEFVDKFDLATSGSKPDVCDHEYVQLNDGATELMPMLGIYCGTTKPNTKYTSGNVLRIKYFTDISEPHAGFMANVTIGRCGGSYYENEGDIFSPEGRVLNSNVKSREFECVYTIEVERGSTIKFVIENMDFPDTEECGESSHLELQEIATYDDTDNITDTIRVCGTHQDKHYIVETNKLVVRYHIKDSTATANTFKLHYSAIGTRCGETVVANRGTLYTPGYPDGVNRPTHCVWRLRVPKGRRVKVEILDFDTGAEGNASATGATHSFQTFRGRISFSNDFQMQSIITRVSRNPPAVVYSTDNLMGIDAFLLSFSRHRGFKLRFSSDEDTQVCEHSFMLSNEFQTMQFKRFNDTDVYCNYFVKMDHNQTLAIHVDKYERNFTSTVYSTFCQYISPMKIELNEQQILSDFLCKNETQPSVRFPFPVTISLLGNKRNKLIELNLRYRTYECGGIYPIYDELNITQPQLVNYTGPMECAWAVWPYHEFSVDDTADLDYWMADTQIEVTLVIDFKGNCEEQYLVVYNGPNQNFPHLGRFCSQSSATNLVVEHGVFVEYYARAYNPQSKFNMTFKHGSGCGGRLSYPFRSITFNDQYKNNVECIWELSTDNGFHIGVAFTDRFFIESSKNCTKDYLKVQQKTVNGDWEDLATICGRDPPKSVNTTTVDMRVIFRSDGDTVGDGFTALFSRNCGGILQATAEPQRISSPGYPMRYENNLYCNYTIVQKEEGKTGVLMQFLDFEVEEPPITRCLFDNVTVEVSSKFDEVKETVLCGVNRSREFRGEKIIVILRTDHSFASKGFLMEYSTNVCGDVVTNSTVIQSPRSHNDASFPHNMECFWNLTAPDGYKILIKFEMLDYEANCDFDVVEVYKSLSPVSNDRLAKFCGNLTGMLPPIHIANNRALIRSNSDASVPSAGFKALVLFLPNCDKRIYLGEQNTTYNFNTFTNNYAHNLDCAYTFATSKGRQLFVQFNAFHVEESANCQDDFLEVRDGGGPFADKIGTFCGHIMPPQLMTSRNALFMRFVSDSAGTSAGFEAVITSAPLVCGESVIEIKEKEHKTVRSPLNTDGKYLSNVNCYWKITSMKSIHLKFDKFDVEGGNTTGRCSGDFLKIYNQEDAELVEKGYGSEATFNGQLSAQDWSGYATEHIYCGSKLPDDYFSTGTTLFMKFQTDDKVEKSGFSVTVMAVEGCFRNFTGTQGRIVIADTTDHCDVYIKAPQNYTLSLYYDDLTFSEYECTEEYIEVFDAHTNSSLQKLCQYAGYEKSLFSSTNELRMRIKMNGYYTKFDITYLASRDGVGCGGDLYNSHGLLTNPFYPNNVRNNSDCRWNIRVPQNLHVLLNFAAFELGTKNTCHSDYLQIIEHNDDGTETVARQFCGEDNPRYYRSENSLISLRFHKTYNYDGTGWAIRFEGVYSNYKIPPDYNY